MSQEESRVQANFQVVWDELTALDETPLETTVVREMSFIMYL